MNKINKRILITFLFTILFSGNIKASEVFSDTCGVILTNKQTDAALALEFKSDINDVSCEIVNFVKNLDDDSIDFNYELISDNDLQFGYQPDTTVTYRGAYLMILSAFDSSVSKNVVTSTVLYPTAASIKMPGFWHNVGITWSNNVTAITQNPAISGYYTKSNGNIVYYTTGNSNAKNLVPVTQVNLFLNPHNGKMTAFKMPSSTISITDSLFRSIINFDEDDTPENVCMGYFYPKSTSWVVGTSLYQWYIYQYGMFYWNGDQESGTTNNYKYKTLCV